MAAAVMALTMSLAGLFTAPAAQAAFPDGITNAKVTYDGEELEDVDEVRAGDKVRLALTYNSDAAGEEVTFKFSDSIIVPESIPNNIADGVESISTDPDERTVTIKFKDGLTSMYDAVIEFDIADVDQTGEGEITWALGDEGGSTTVRIVKKGDDKFTGDSGASKENNRGTITDLVSIEDGNVVVDEKVLEEAIGYTLTLVYDGEAGSAPTMSFEDVLPEGMEYVQDSFKFTYDVWDEDGYNHSSDDGTIDSGVNFDTTGDQHSFEYNHTADPAPSVDQPWKLQITYQAKLTQDGLDALEEQLQGAYDDLDGHGDFYSAEWKNEATVSEYEVSSSFKLKGNKPQGPGVYGGDFAKRTDGWSEGIVTVDDDGNLDPAQDVTYLFRINWSKWDQDSLDEDIVIVDELPDGVEWDIDTSEDLVWGPSKNTPPSSITSADGNCDASIDAGTYCVDGAKLIINLGTANDAKDNHDGSLDKVYVWVPAKVVSLDKEDGQEQDSGLVNFPLKNSATFSVGGGDGIDKSTTITPKTRGDDPVQDTNYFEKNGGAESAEAGVGETVKFNYTITVKKGAGIDARESHIVDYLDPVPNDLFDLGDDLENVNATMSYAGTDLDAEDFTMELDEDGNLRFELTDSGKDVVTEEGVDKQWQVKIGLETRELQGDDGKETIEVNNRASVFGSSGEDYNDSSGTSSSSSYGNSLELDKRVFDCQAEEGENEWTKNVPAWFDQDGEIVQDTFVFRLGLIAHGTYGSSGIVGSESIDADDVLPAGMTFKGFVDPDEIDCDAGEGTDAVELGGNLQVTPLDDDRGVNITVKDDEFFHSDDSPYYVYFAVEVTDEGIEKLKEEGELVNFFGKTDARVEKVQPSILIEKWTEEEGSNGPEFDEDGNLLHDGYPGDFDDGTSKQLVPETQQTINFTISNDGDENLINLHVSDELTDGVGELTDLECESPEDGILRPGEQFTCEATFEGMPAGETHRNNATVTAEGEESGIEVDDEDEWNAHTPASYAIGDYVWVDTNKDGLQDDGEDPLEGVKVELTDADGEPVTDVFGDEVEPTFTDAQGRYLFDDLPAGEYKVKFTLTDDQVEKYIFTELSAGDDTAVDSDADPATGWTQVIVLNDDNTALTTDYDREVLATQGIDPTWDAGVVLKSTPTTPGDDGEEDADDDDSGSRLPDSGMDLNLGIVVLAAALLAAGAGAVRVARRKN